MAAEGRRMEQVGFGDGLEEGKVLPFVGRKEQVSVVVAVLFPSAGKR